MELGGLGGGDGGPVAIFIKGHPHLLGVHTKVFRDYMVRPKSLQNDPGGRTGGVEDGLWAA